MNYRAMLKVIAFSAIVIFMGAMEVGTLTGPHVGSVHTYYAMFGGTDGVSGLRDGNQVRAAGVAVGQVTSVDLVDSNHAKVTFTANNNQKLTTNTWAVVRYADLLGQRYLALTQSGATPETQLKPGATIPSSRTKPALSLTALFNGFRPLFAALTPQQVNELAQDVIDILQGQSTSLDDLFQKTASLTTNLAARDQTFTQVVDTLSSLLTTVAKHDNQLATMVTALNTLTSALHQEGPALFDSLNSVDGLVGSVSGLLARLEDHSLPGDISDLQQVTAVLAANAPTVDKLIVGFNAAFSDFSRITQNGGFVNAYVCELNATLYGTANITGGDVINALTNTLGLGGLLSKLGLGSLSLLKLQLNLPLKLPPGPIGDQSVHTKVCQ